MSKKDKLSKAEILNKVPAGMAMNGILFLWTLTISENPIFVAIILFIVSVSFVGAALFIPCVFLYCFLRKKAGYKKPIWYDEFVTVRKRLIKEAEERGYTPSRNSNSGNMINKPVDRLTDPSYSGMPGNIHYRR